MDFTTLLTDIWIYVESYVPLMSPNEDETGLALLITFRESLRCALYILKCLNITFRMIFSLGHTKIRRIALLNFLLTMASFPDARAEKRFSVEEVISEALCCMH